MARVSHRPPAASQTRDSGPAPRTIPMGWTLWETQELAEFISIYGVWLVAVFIALESIGIPLPAEAALIAAGFFAARTHGIDIWSLIAGGIVAAIFGEIVGFWIGRWFGHGLLMRYGARLGFTEERIRIGEWLFDRYGGRFVFIARFLPFLRNIAAVLAGTNSMAQHNFYFASATAAVAWIICYGLGAYSFGEAFADLASPVAILLGLAAALIISASPVLFLRYETRLNANADLSIDDERAVIVFSFFLRHQGAKAARGTRHGDHQERQPCATRNRVHGMQRFTDCTETLVARR